METMIGILTFGTRRAIGMERSNSERSVFSINNAFLQKIEHGNFTRLTALRQRHENEILDRKREING